MEKLGEAKRFLSKTVAPTLVKLANQRDALMEKNAELERELSQYRRAERMQKIATTMEGKGAWVGTSFKDRYDYVKTAAAEGADLKELEAAVNMMTADGGIGTMATKVASGGDTFSEFTAAILGS
jgi:hypothetical protein